MDMINNRNNIPPDLSYSQWFYYNIRNLKTKMNSSSTQIEAAPPVEPYFNKPVNEKIDPIKWKLLTQDLETDQILSVQQLSRYKLSIERRELEATRGKKRKVGNRGGIVEEPHHLLLSLQPQITIIDRRPMLKRRELNALKPKSTAFTASLISPEEDCDGDSDLEEIIEIDCD